MRLGRHIILGKVKAVPLLLSVVSGSDSDRENIL